MVKYLISFSISLSLLFVTSVSAGGLFDNSYVNFEETDLTIRNIAIGNTSYWVTWTLDENLNFVFNQGGLESDNEATVDFYDIWLAGKQEVPIDSAELDSMRNAIPAGARVFKFGNVSYAFLTDTEAG